MIYRFYMRWSLRSVLLWSVALIAVLTLYASFYPSIGKEANLADYLSELPAPFIEALGLEKLSSGAGWVHATFFGLLGLFILAGAAVVWGANAIAGEEERGGLELVLSRGISRRSYYWQSFAVVVTKLATCGVLVILWLLVVTGPFELGLTIPLMIAQFASYISFTAFIAAISLVTGAIANGKGVAVGVGAAAFVYSYMLDAIAKAVPNYEWLSNVSPVGWVYGKIPLMDGWQWGGLLALWTVTLIALLIGRVAFQRRDINY